MSGSENDKSRIGIVGAGVMGRGIAQLFAQSGYPVCLYDADAGAVSDAVGFIRKMVNRQVDKGKYARPEGEKILSNLIVCNKLEELSDCHVLIETIVEILEAKKQLFTELERLVSTSAVLASNTSSLLVADIASACANPGRVAGLHFFNPAPLMRVVEIIPAILTKQAVIDELVSLVSSTGHRAVIAADQPGFLVNHAGRGFTTEALRILEERVAGPADIDRVMREALGFRMGPFELLDLTGLDVSGKVAQSVYDQFQQDPLFRPSSLLPPRMAAGLFGRKTGRGFYRYENNQKVEPEASPTPKIDPTKVGLTKVWLAQDGTDHSRQLAQVLKANGARLMDSAAGKDTMIMLQFWGNDVSNACAELNLDPTRAVALDPLPDLRSRRTLMLSPVTTVEVRDGMHGLLSVDEVPVTVINDSPGFISQRILATIVNIAGNIAQRGIATVPDIEDAVTLGLGYPLGPLAWGDKVGGAKIVEILSNMFRLTNDPRYRVSLWLRRRAQSGASLLTREAGRK